MGTWARRIVCLLPAVALAAAGVQSSMSNPSYNTNDPTVFAPHCLNPLHRSYKHCLDGASVGGVTLTGSTLAGNSTSSESQANTIDMLSGQEYEFSLDTPPPCPPVLKAPQAACTVSIKWAPLYGASLAVWGVNVHDTLAVVPYLGCEDNNRMCNFSVSYESPEGPALLDGTALRVTAVANVYGLACGSTAVGFCEHWADWLLRLHNAKAAPQPARPATTATTTTPPTSLFTGAPPGTVAVVVEKKSVTPGQRTSAYVQRDGMGPRKLLYSGDFLQPGDVIGTDGNTVMALEFALGGRVGVNKSSEIEITTERSVNSTTTDALKISKGGLWAKCGALKEPLEIQTNGGVIGIKG